LPYTGRHKKKHPFKGGVSTNFLLIKKEIEREERG